MGKETTLMTISSHQENSRAYEIEYLILSNSKEAIEAIIARGLTKDDQEKFVSALKDRSTSTSKKIITKSIRDSNLTLEQKLRYQYILSLQTYINQVFNQFNKIEKEKFNYAHNRYFNLLRKLATHATDLFFKIIEESSIKKPQDLVVCIENVLLNILSPVSYDEMPDWEKFKEIETYNKLKKALVNSNDAQQLAEASNSYFKYDIRNVFKREIDNKMDMPMADFVPVTVVDHIPDLTSFSFFSNYYDKDTVYQSYKAEYDSRNTMLNQYNIGYKRVNFDHLDNIENAITAIKGHYAGLIPEGPDAVRNGDIIKTPEELRTDLNNLTTIKDIEDLLSAYSIDLPLNNDEHLPNLEAFKERIVEKWGASKKELDKYQKILDFRKEELKEQHQIKQLFSNTSKKSVVSAEMHQKISQALGGYIGRSFMLWNLTDKEGFESELKKLFAEGSKMKTFFNIALVLLPIFKLYPGTNFFVPLLEGLFTSAINTSTGDSKEYKKLLAIDKKLDDVLLKISEVASHVLLKLKRVQSQQGFDEIKNNIIEQKNNFVDITTFYLEVENGVHTKNQKENIEKQLEAYKRNLEKLSNYVFGDQFGIKEILKWDKEKHKKDTKICFGSRAYVTILFDSLIQEQHYKGENQKDTKYTFDVLHKDIKTFFVLLKRCYEVYFDNINAAQKALSVYAMKTRDATERKNAKNIIGLYKRFIEEFDIDNTPQKSDASIIYASIVTKFSEIENYLLSGIRYEYDSILKGEPFIIALENRISYISKDENATVFAVENDKLVSSTVKSDTIGFSFNAYKFKALQVAGQPSGVFILTTGALSKNATLKYIKVIEDKKDVNNDKGIKKNDIRITTYKEKATLFSIGIKANRDIYLYLAKNPKEVLSKHGVIGNTDTPVHITIYKESHTPKNSEEDFTGFNLYTAIQTGNYIERNTRYFSPNGAYYLTSKHGNLSVYNYIDGGKKDVLHYSLGNKEDASTSDKNEVLFENNGVFNFINTVIKELDKTTDSNERPKFEFITKNTASFEYGIDHSELLLNNEGNLIIKDRAGDLIWESQPKHTIYDYPDGHTHFALVAHCNFEKAFNHRYPETIVHGRIIPTRIVYDAVKEHIDDYFFMSFGNSASNELTPTMHIEGKSMSLCRFERKEDFHIIKSKNSSGIDFCLTELPNNTRDLVWKAAVKSYANQKFGIGWKSTTKEKLFYIWSKNTDESDISNNKLGYRSYKNLGDNKRKYFKDACKKTGLIVGGNKPLYFSRIFQEDMSLSNLSGACYNDSEKKYYFFKGVLYWERERGGEITGPFPIKRFDENLPEYIDGVCYSSKKKTFFFFKDGKCYIKKYLKLKKDKSNLKAYRSNLKEETSLNWGGTDILNKLDAVCCKKGEFYLIANGYSHNVDPDTGKISHKRTVASDWGSHTPERPDALCYAAHVNDQKGGYYFFKDDKYQSRKVGSSTSEAQYLIQDF